MSHLFEKIIFKLSATIWLLLLTPLAYAVTYSLPAALGSGPFSSCSGGGPSYTCTSAITLGNNDTLNLTADMTLNLDREFTTGSGLLVNANGFTLSINAARQITIGDNSSFTGNLTTTAGNRDIVLGDNVTITGDLSAGDDFRAGDNLIVVGNISANGDDVTIGDGANITGNLFSNDDLMIGNSATVTGNINSGDDISLGQNSTYVGDITAADTLSIGSGTTVAGTCSPFHAQCSSYPIVTSMTRDQADPTTLTTLSWTVTFSSSVTGVDSTDFSLVMTGGVSGALITSVTGSGTSWTVTVDSGIGNGTLGLNLVDNDSIIDGSARPLGGVGSGNGSFTGEVYSINKPPTTLNTYYPGSSSVAAGATSVVLGVAGGATTPISSGDLLLIMQMQDASINNTNTSSYGSGVAGDPGSGTSGVGGSGLFEYVVASSNVPLTGGTLTISCGLTNSYTRASATGTSGQKTFQVIRVPTFVNYTLPPVTASAWNGSTGGVLAFDVTGNLSLNGATINLDGMGFRGGAIRTYTSGSGSYTDYRTPALSNNANGTKGEGIAGTPYQAFTAPDQITLNPDGEGYPFGSRARGAPGNAGGGGTDRNPPNNDQNSGGGGGANGGDGGIGGIGWCPGFNTTPPYYGCGYAALVSAVNPNGSTGGFGGKAVSGLGASRLTLGGGGGAATANNITGSGACAAINGLCSSGAAGGGIIMIRAGTMTGTATLSAKGSAGDSTIGKDGSGGGGAGGAILISAGSGMSGVTIDVSGGAGGSNLVPSSGYSSNPHGPGGGGGGGIAITSATTAGCSAAGGVNGVTYRVGNPFGAYGATSGSSGSCSTALNSSQIPGATLGGASSCFDHYAISHSGNGVTCEATAVTVSAHSSTHSAETPSNTTTITLSTTSANPSTESWSLKSGGGSFTAPDQYRFNGVESAVEFWYSQTTPETAIDIDVTDGTITEVDDGNNANGKDAEDPSIDFTDTAFRFVDTSASPTTAITIATQIAGKPSSTAAPVAQTIGLQPIRTDTASGECQPLFVSQTTSVNLGYECNNPTSCFGADLLNLAPESTYNAASAVTLGRHNSGDTTATTAVDLAFDANGIAPLSFIYSDAGRITLHASKTLTADNTTTPPIAAATLSGSSNAFVARPFAFDLDFSGLRAADWAGNGALDGSNGDSSYATGAGGSVFITAGSDFDMTIKALLWSAVDADLDGFPDDDANLDGVADAGANLTDNNPTPNFGKESTAPTISLGYALNSPLGGNDGFLTVSNVGTTGTTDSSATVALPYTNAEFTSGATLATLRWNEVGIIDITANLTSYLGSGFDIPGAADNVGRFTPASFALTLNNSPSFAEQVSNTFTYLGQNFVYNTAPQVIIRAVAADGVSVTQNYEGLSDNSGYWKLGSNISLTGGVCGSASGFCYTDLSAITDSSGHAVPLTTPATTVAYAGTTTTNGQMAVTLHAGQNFIYSKPVDSDTVNPFDADVRLNLVVLDSDGITGSLPTTTDSAHIGFLTDTLNDPDAIPLSGDESYNITNNSLIRMGRATLTDVYGATESIVSMPLAAEFYDGANWVANSADSSTAIAATSTTCAPNGFASCSVDGTAASLQVSGTATVGTAGNFFTLTPTIAITGVATISLLTPSWLTFDWDGNALTPPEYASATATFGIYRGDDRFYYWREER
jgi:cytoskeletal protein CcmA (bactofilin family)